ncbi:MAG: hypothetical protein ACREFD_12045 [Stellaceae bacterium]
MTIPFGILDQSPIRPGASAAAAAALSDSIAFARGAEALNPGRIDPRLGHAPGADWRTTRALAFDLPSDPDG